MSSKVLITGGAGFIGSHVADELLRHGYSVVVLDNLCPQVHGKDAGRPRYLDDRVELVKGDVRDCEAVHRALIGVDRVIHLAAQVGVGQSMYEVAEYVSVNDLGTAVLLEELVKNPVARLVVASSMSVYGEGRYRDAAGAIHDRVERDLDQLRAARWEPERAGLALEPVATAEDKTPGLSSVYALSKYDQERMSLILGQAYGIPTVALRFFNTYGPRQALSNPYTGVLAIFASRLLNGRPPLIFEDGRQKRDFVSVHDVARSCRLSLESKDAPGHAINVGSGQAITVLEVAERVARALQRSEIRPELTGRYRMGDVRHCFADIELAGKLLDYRPQVSFEQGLRELVAWLADQEPVDRVDSARRELESRGLTV